MSSDWLQATRELAHCHSLYGSAPKPYILRVEEVYYAFPCSVWYTRVLPTLACFRQGQYCTKTSDISRIIRGENQAGEVMHTPASNQIVRIIVSSYCYAVGSANMVHFSTDCTVILYLLPGSPPSFHSKWERRIPCPLATEFLLKVRVFFNIANFWSCILITFHLCVQPPSYLFSLAKAKATLRYCMVKFHIQQQERNIYIKRPKFVWACDAGDNRAEWVTHSPSLVYVAAGINPGPGSVWLRRRLLVKRNIRGVCLAWLKFVLVTFLTAWHPSQLVARSATNWKRTRHTATIYLQALALRCRYAVSYILRL